MSVPNCRHNPYADPIALSGAMASAECDECMAEFAAHVRQVFDRLAGTIDTPRQDA